MYSIIIGTECGDAMGEIRVPQIPTAGMCIYTKIKGFKNKMRVLEVTMFSSDCMEHNISAVCKVEYA